MRNPKLLALPAVVILGLLMSGLAFAHWSEILWIEGSVATGELDVELINVSSSDPPGSNDEGVDKDVGCTTVDMIDNDGDGDFDTALITITNAYPCYEVYVHFTVHNNGTIPAHFKGFGPQPPFAYNPVTYRWEASLFDGAITIHGWDGYGEQIHPCQNFDYTIWIHIEQAAEENTTYQFTIEVWFDQWNAP